MQDLRQRRPRRRDNVDADAPRRITAAACFELYAIQPRFEPLAFGGAAFLAPTRLAPLGGLPAT